jgi:hypothetical protein
VQTETCLCGLFQVSIEAPGAVFIAAPFLKTIFKMKKFLFFLQLIFFCLKINAQINDAQLWENINLEKNISKRLLIRINQEGRISENITRPSFNYFDLGLNYKFNKHIHFTIAYVWAEKRLVTDFWSTRYQAYADVTFRKKMKGFMLTDRQMVLWQVKDYFVSAKGKIPDYYLRNKITVKYEREFRFQPYIASEIYYKINQPASDYHFNRVRYFAGIFYHPNLINEFEAYYLLENHFHEKNPQTNWVIGLGYSHTF